MPCTYTGSLEGDRAYFAEKNSEQLAADLVKTTQLLCELCERIENHNDNVNIKMIFPPGVALWWGTHKKIDQERVRREAALAKLTSEERKLLNL